MSDGAKPRVQRNKRTGELRVSYDDGATWQPVALPGQGAPAPDPTLTPGRETPTPVPRETVAPAQPSAPRGFGDWLTEGAGMVGDAAGRFVDHLGVPSMDDVAQTGADLVRGVGRGVTFDAMAPASAALTPTVDDGTGIPREYAAGSPDADLTQQRRREDAEAQARSPLATAAGRGLGTAAVLAPAAAAAIPAAGGAAATTGLGTVAQAALPAVAAGALARGGAAMDPNRSFGDWMGEVADPNAVALDATIGAGVPAVGGLVAEGATAAAPVLRGAANRTRAAASGAYGGELKKLREAKGPQAADELGDAIERTGIRPSGFVPKSARSYMEGSERVREELGDTIGQSLTQFDDLNVRTPRADVESGLLGKARALNQGVTDDAATGARTVGRVLDRTRARYGDELKPTELHALKRETERAGGFKPGTVRGPRDTAKAEANQDAADVFRSELDRAVTEQVDIPELTGPYRAAMRDYGHADDANTLASKRVDHELGNQIFSLPTIMGGITGAGAGAAGGSMTSGLVGAGLGAGGVALSKLYGKDIAANTLRGLQHGAEVTADAAGIMRPAAPAATSGFADWLADDPSPPMPAGPGPSRMPPPTQDDPEHDESDGALARVRRQRREAERLMEQ